MAMQTVFYVQLTRYEDDPDGPLSGGFSLRPDLESAFDAVRDCPPGICQMSRTKEFSKS